VAREWGRIGCIGFGGPPAHIALLRRLCVDRRGWLEPHEFEDAVAACNLLPGPASTQLAIFTAWRVGGLAGGLVGGLAFVLPGLVAMVALAAVFLASHPPAWIRGAGLGAGAAVAAVAVRTAASLVPASRRRATRSGDAAGMGGAPAGAYDERAAHARAARWRWFGYALAGGVIAVLAGPWVVLALLASGAVETAVRAGGGGAPLAALWPAALGRPRPAALLAAGTGGLGALAWVAFKVGALSYGGGFVIVPLMQGDAVGRHHWMTAAQFLDAVALGQVTPGPVTHTVSAVGYAAAGVGGALLAAAVAFAPSFAFVLGGAARFDRLRASARARAFLDGAGPAAIGAILGSAVPLALALTHAWQAAVLAAAAVALLGLRRPIVETLVLAGAAGALLTLLGAPV
jgi:chromate transporter